MGNDGGSIPKRRELVKEAAKNPTAQQLKETQNEQQEYFWSNDPLTRKPLARPVVSDGNGKLYNKDSIIEHLLAVTTSDDPIPAEVETVLQGAVHSLKDVVELRYTLGKENPDKTNGNSTSRTEVWLCPVTNEPLGPGTRAAYIVPCGHVFSGVAINEVSGDKCVVCEASYAPNDVIPILPTAKEDIARLLLRSKTLKEQGLSHSLRKVGKKEKMKSSKKRAREEEEAEPVKSTKATGKEGNGEPRRSENGGINNSSTRALTDKVLAEEERRKKLKAGNENLKSLFSSRDQSKPIGRSSDFMTRGYEIPANAKR